jgi:putative PIN family toxin of toxin-antitoxin system
VKPILVDTNVLVSALVFGGTPATVLQIIESLGMQLAVSSELEAELADTLADKFGWAAERIAEARNRLFRGSCQVDPPELTGVVRDADDHHVLAAAAAAEAAMIVTGDKDLLTLGAFKGIRIVTPAEFVSAIVDNET